MKILVLNAGSSSLKYQLFNRDNNEVIASGNAERIAIDGGLIKHKDGQGNKSEFPGNLADHSEALTKILEILVSPEQGAISSLEEINAVGHRVVHGGEAFKSSVLITDEVKNTIRDLIPLAPLHNPANLIGIEACEKTLPEVPNIAVFDTAFHQTMKPEHFLYAIPREYYEKLGIRRYGFHGTSHDYVSHRACEILGKEYKNTKIITCHVGNGGSITAIKNGNVVNTSMGFTPLEGLMMGTRCGDIDPAIIPFLMKNEGLSINEIDAMMNKKSGILGLMNNISSDHREVEEGFVAGKELETEVIKVYTNRILKYIGAYTAYMNGVNVIVLTAGTLENSAVERKLIVDQLEWLGVKLDEEKNNFRGEERVISTPESKVTVIVVPTNEEYMIAKDTYELVH
ncbi:MAG: acetate kinase [Candidatus Absconditabacteria bacterium]|nr:acetate kinase [Candidatus Absconditabacteria bacterium]MDD3868348.1 acetate kinase [Candidatus Absconditabacteria bacterium]MDD4714423.1 acetate kinase [Candidatus Absconditabacteria bacterium]